MSHAHPIGSRTPAIAIRVPVRAGCHRLWLEKFETVLCHGGHGHDTLAFDTAASQIRSWDVFATNAPSIQFALLSRAWTLHSAGPRRRSD